MSGKLARVRWEMGQALLPDHFVAQEEALTADAQARHRTRGLPATGIAALKVNDTLLAEGIFSVRTLTVMMPSGLLLDVPGNAVISSFNLNVPGTVSVPVYLHRVGEAEQEAEGEEAEDPFPRVIHKLVLSSEQGLSEALETLKIAQFEKDPDGAWRLSGKFIPPLVQVGTSPFLVDSLKVIAESLEPFQYKLTQEIAASYLSGDSLTSAKQCLKAVYGFQRLLADLFHKVHPHPYYLLEALKAFYTEVCFYQNTVPEHISDPYDDDRLGACFGQVLDPLIKLLQLTRAPSPYLPFALEDNLFKVAMPARTREAREVYFLVQKESAGQNVSLKEVKLAGTARVSLVHKLALQGIPLRRIERPPFQHSFGAEVDFYMVTMGEEWDHALRELSVAFYHTPQLAGIKFYLYWRFD